MEFTPEQIAAEAQRQQLEQYVKDLLSGELPIYEESKLTADGAA